ncbi:hypothetical protein TGRUB_362070 [Toxoplasma gondii RUB]|uniref:Uncharacterized protein n=3 Tax=Toxoplasma gondii TaxID=5811 RepID=A0A086LIX0_TOXGO|nr:hypothetical protein TGFOU_362070 [Toxoplasma gondii FOU]KFG56588.1 hypothetical protein TGRUB_362070 [Toxoplasma gondii RUB]PUA86302.1 hypothetical protein TGBR9_362070 [Toxoplasma gondii TgCATBr9]
MQKFLSLPLLTQLREKQGNEIHFLVTVSRAASFEVQKLRFSESLFQDTWRRNVWTALTRRVTKRYVARNRSRSPRRWTPNRNIFEELLQIWTNIYSFLRVS